MSENDLITKEEIELLRKGAKTLSAEDVLRALSNKKSPVVPVDLKSGYKVSMTIDEVGKLKIEHVSVCREGGTDNADAEIIANAILGKHAKGCSGICNPGNIHFYKLER